MFVPSLSLKVAILLIRDLLSKLFPATNNKFKTVFILQIILFVISLILFAVTYSKLPNQVGIHESNGKMDSYVSKNIAIAICMLPQLAIAVYTSLVRKEINRYSILFGSAIFFLCSVIIVFMNLNH